MKFLIDSVTVKSPDHESNEDSFICNDRYIAVADGMGGEACGEVASKIAISAISAALDGPLSKKCSEADARELSFSAISRADKEILKYIDSHPGSDGMGTTVVLAVRIGQNLHVAWCGDSRCYYYNPSNGLRSLTTDHSYVQQLIDENRLSEEESFAHPCSNLITRYVGGGEDTCKPEFVSLKLDKNGVVILCSDGLSGYCKNDDIERALRSSQYKNLAERLLKLAVSRGSDDDITIVTLTPDAGPGDKKVSIFSWLKKLVH